MTKCNNFENIKYKLICMPFAIWIYILSLTPIISRDALKLHMALPKLWKDADFFYFQKFNAKIELSMLNLDYLYMILLKFCEWEGFPKILHASFLIFTGILIYRFIQEKYDEKFASLAFIITTTIPITQRLASEVYVDLGILFFSTVAIINFIRWVDSEFKSNKYFMISALGSGFAFGTKYNAMIFAVLMVLFVGFVYSKKIKKNLLPLKYMFFYSLIIGLSVSPWLFRNYMGSGNPLYPLFDSIFKSDIVFEKPFLEGGLLDLEFIRRKVEGESLLEVLLLPIRFFFTGKDHDFLQFDGKLNPMLILLLPILFFFRKKNDELVIKNKKGLLNYHKKILFYLFLITMLITVFKGARVRYMIYCLPPLIILNIDALYLLSKQKFKKLALVVITIYLGYNINYSINLFDRLDTYKYLTSEETKDEYLIRKLTQYKIYKYINMNTKKDAVIYDVLCGNRMYYVDREYICPPGNLNWTFFNATNRNSTEKDYYSILKNLPNTDSLKATHLLIKPNGYMSSFLEIYKDHKDSLNIENKQKLQNFINFINKQKPLIIQDGSVLYEIKYDDKE